MRNCGVAPTDLPLLGSLPSNKPLKQTSVCFPPLSSCSEQVCLESSDLLHMPQNAPLSARSRDEQLRYGCNRLAVIYHYYCYRLSVVQTAKPSSTCRYLLLLDLLLLLLLLSFVSSPNSKALKQTSNQPINHKLMNLYAVRHGNQHRTCKQAISSERGHDGPPLTPRSSSFIVRERAYTKPWHMSSSMSCRGTHMAMCLLTLRACREPWMRPPQLAPCTNPSTSNIQPQTTHACFASSLQHRAILSQCRSTQAPPCFSNAWLHTTISIQKYSAVCLHRHHNMQACVLRHDGYRCHT